MDSGVRNTWIAVLGLTVLGALLRFATLDAQSFWLDELVTVSLLRLDFDDMLDAIPESEATPYLYYGRGRACLRPLEARVRVEAASRARPGPRPASRRPDLSRRARSGTRPIAGCCTRGVAAADSSPTCLPR